MDRRKQILCAEGINHTTCHLNDVALYHILYYQVTLICMETSYFEYGGWKELPHMLSEEQDGGIFHLAISGKQSKITQHIPCRGVGFFLIHTSCLNTALQEIINSVTVDVITGCPEDWYVIP